MKVEIKIHLFAEVEMCPKDQKQTACADNLKSGSNCSLTTI